MIENIPASRGSYVLVGKLKKDCTLKIGSLGEFSLNPGYYFYCGNARGRGGLRSRIGHHCTMEKKIHWHIDYFAQNIFWKSVFWCADESVNECCLIKTFNSIKEVTHPIKGFGASDCKNGCTSHLCYSSSYLYPQSLIQRNLRSGVLLHQTSLARNLIES